jgi:exodeoxyribonuclease VII large subunit
MADKLSLTELQLLIRDSLYLALPQNFWVVAEISEITVNSSGHCYLELVEKNNDEKNVRARIRGIVWSSRFSFIRSYFENITGETLRSGLKILVKAKVEYHELYGLSLVISDIDPSFTLGEMEVKRQLIIKKLEEEGVFSMNRELEFPVLPQRIAIVSSKNAAGYTDFIDHLTGNSYGYVFYTALIETPMQGTDTEVGVVSALDRIAGHSELFDVVVIIRGGGSQTDLSWFDSYAIAYHVTQFPLPVITGIGHEKNMSVTDMVAFSSLKTPTAVADFLIDAMAAAENKLDEMSSDIRELVRMNIEENRNLLAGYSSQLLPLARVSLSASRERISARVMQLARSGKESTYRSGIITAGLQARLFSSVKAFSAGQKRSAETASQRLISLTLNSLKVCREKLSSIENELNILNPENVLRRGYTITSLDGKILKYRTQVSAGDIIDTRFIDGKVKSKVTVENQAQNWQLFPDPIKIQK